MYLKEKNVSIKYDEHKEFKIFINSNYCNGLVHTGFCQCIPYELYLLYSKETML